MRKLMAVALVAATLSGVLAGAAGASSYVRPKGQSCEIGYYGKVRHHWVWVGRPRRHVKRGYVVCVPKPVTAPAPTVYAYAAHLDPTYTQNPSNALDVTFTAVASATVNGNPDPSLPSGILDLYSDGLLACSANVGGAKVSTTCEVTYAAFGNHQLITEYIPNGVNPVSETDTENIQPFPIPPPVAPTVTLGTPTIGAESVDSSNNWAVTYTIPVSVTGSGAAPTGSVMINGTACGPVGSSCSATVEQSVSGALVLSPTITYSGDSNYLSASVTGAVTIPVAPPPTVTDVATTTTLHAPPTPGDGEYQATVSPAPVNGVTNVGSVTFADADGTICVVSGGGFGIFNCSDSDGLSAVTATYSGGTVFSGDSAETVYESSVS